MANEGGFTAGIKDAMSAMQGFASIAYMGSLQQSQEEGLRLRQKELESLEANRRHNQAIADQNQLEFVLRNADKFDDQTVLNATNSFSVKYGGASITPGEMGEFNTALDAEKEKMGALTTGQERRDYLSQLHARSGQHPAMRAALLRRQNEFQELADIPEARAALNAVLPQSLQSTDYIKDMRPGTVLKMVQDNDTRKMMVFNAGNRVVNDMLDGKTVADGTLREALTSMQMAGFKVGDHAKEMVTNTVGSAHYNQLLVDGRKLKNDVVEPLNKAVKGMNPDAYTYNFATTPQTTSVFGGRIMETNLAAATSGLPPDQQAAFTQIFNDRDRVIAESNQSLTQMRNRAKLILQNPTTTTTEAALVKQNLKLEEEFNNLKTEPYRRLDRWLQEPSKKNWTSLTNALTDHDAKLNSWAQDRDQMLTMAEQKEKQEIARSKTESALKQATNDFGQHFLSEAGSHPEWFDEDGTLDVSSAAKVMAPIADSVSKQWGVKVDATDVLKEMASASKRSVPNTNTNLKLTPEQAGLTSGMYSAAEAVHQVQTQLVKEGKVDRVLLFEKATNLPFMAGRDIVALEKDYFAVRKYLETGKAATEQEIQDMWDRSGIKSTDPDHVIRHKLERMDTFYRRAIKLQDPEGKLQGRTGFNIDRVPKPAGREPSPGEAARETFPSFEDWKKNQKR